MKYILFILFNISSMIIYSQTTNVDSLCNCRYDSTTIWSKNHIYPGPKEVASYCFQRSEIDSTLCEFRVPFMKEKLHGWYSLTSNRREEIDGIRYGLDISYIHLLAGGKWDRKFYYNISACFNHGLPVCKWEYVIMDTERGDYYQEPHIYKTVEYEDGLISGDYLILKVLEPRPEMGYRADTIYHTRFEKGTGHYKDYYPNRKLRIDGMLKHGYKDGHWLYYVSSNNEYTNIILEIYDMGKRVYSETFMLRNRNKQ